MSHRSRVATMVASVLMSMVAVPGLAGAASPSPGLTVTPSVPPTAPAASASPGVVASPEVVASPSIPTGDPALEARFPTEIGGTPLTISSVSGAEMEAQFPESDPATGQLIGVLATQGKTVHDLSAANASAETEGGFVAIIALQIAGADASALIDGFAPLVIGYDEFVKTGLQAGGKDIIELTPTNSGPSVEPIYVRATGDILWFVSGQQAMLDTVFGALP